VRKERGLIRKKMFHQHIAFQEFITRKTSLFRFQVKKKIIVRYQIRLEAFSRPHKEKKVGKFLLKHTLSQ
jgi:hypothetical protein